MTYRVQNLPAEMSVCSFGCGFLFLHGFCYSGGVCILPARIGLGVGYVGIILGVVRKSLTVHSRDERDHTYQQYADHYIEDHLSELVIGYQIFHGFKDTTI